MLEYISDHIIEFEASSFSMVGDQMANQLSESGRGRWQNAN